MLHTKPENPAEAFFDFPHSRVADLCAARIAERYKENWRTPRAEVSAASSPDNPKVLDNGTERALHDILVSNTFGFHPMFGTGHVLRTNGVICLFWNGEVVQIVEQANVTKLPVVIAPWGPRGLARKKSRRQELLDRI